MTSSSSRRHPYAALIVSSHCKANACVGIGLDGDRVVVVDTKADGASLRLSRTEWTDFTVQVKNGELDAL